MTHVRVYRREYTPMKQIKVTKNEPIDECLKRLKEMVFLEGTLDEVRRLRAHETPKERKIRKARRAARMAKYLKLQSQGKYISPENIELGKNRTKTRQNNGQKIKE